MRHEAFLLTRDQSLALIAEVDSWCRRTGSNYNKLVTAARVNASIRSYVRHHGGRLTFETASRLRNAIEANPRGIDKAKHKLNVRLIATQRLTVQRARFQRNFPAAVTPQIVDRSPCPKCGTRRDIGCKHFERQSAWG